MAKLPDRDARDMRTAALVPTRREAALLEQETLRAMREQVEGHPVRAELGRGGRTFRPSGSMHIDEGSNHMVSPGRRRCMVPQSLAGIPGIHIDVWALPDLRFESELRVGAGNQDGIESDDARDDSDVNGIDWFDDNHLLVYRASGVLECHRVAGGCLWRKKLGDCVRAVAVEGDLVAVSLLPPADRSPSRHPHAQGVKLYMVEGDIERGDLRLLNHWKPGSFPFWISRLYFGRGACWLYVYSAWNLKTTPGEKHFEYLGQIDLRSDRLQEPARDLPVRELCQRQIEEDYSAPSLSRRADGALIAANSAGWQQVDSAQPLVGAAPGVRLGLETSGDGAWVAINLNLGQLHVSRRGGPFEPLKAFDPLAAAGYHFTYYGFINDRELVLQVSQVSKSGGGYELVRLDLETLQLSTAGGPLLLPEAHAVDSSGRLCVGTRTGVVRRLDPRLEAVDTADAGGSIDVLAAEPGSNRLAAVTSAHRFLWLDGDGAPPRYLRIGPLVSSSKGVFVYDRAFFTPQGGLYVTGQDSRHAFIDGETGVLVLNGVPRTKLLNRFDIAGRDFTDKSSFALRGLWTLPMECCGIAAVGEEVVLLSRDGRLVRFDHRRCPLRKAVPLGADFPREVIDPGTLAEILRVPDVALGLTVLGPGEIASWTTKELTIVTLATATLVETGRRTVPIEDVNSVRRDPRNGGIITAHLSHLSFFTADLVEHLRMWPLLEDTVLWQAPPPPSLAATGHPGYFWREEGMDRGFLSAFRVLDKGGEEVEKEEAKRAFLEQYFSHELVVRASRDWPGYLESLERAQQRVATPTPLLLSPWSGGDSRRLPEDSP
jgi:hypothetical protein